MCCSQQSQQCHLRKLFLPSAMTTTTMMGLAMEKNPSIERKWAQNGICKFWFTFHLLKEELGGGSEREEKLSSTLKSIRRL